MAFAHVLAFCRAMVAEISDYVQMPTADEEKEIAQHWEGECRDAGTGGGGGGQWGQLAPTALKLWGRRPSTLNCESHSFFIFVCFCTCTWVSTKK